MTQTTITVDFEDVNVIIAHGIYSGLAQIRTRVADYKKTENQSPFILKALQEDETKLRKALHNLEQALFDGGDTILGFDHKQTQLMRES